MTKIKIDLTPEMLNGSVDLDQTKLDIRESLSTQYMNVNMVLHTNDHWINQVRKEEAHDPSMYIARNIVSIEGGQLRSTGQHNLTESAAIAQLKENNQWEKHAQECEKRFSDSQNWTRLMSLVQIYESWEGDYRHALMKCIDLDSDLIKSKIKNPKLGHSRFGDLRHIRNKFLHNRGVFAGHDPDTLFESVNVLFKENKPMILTAKQHNKFRELIFEDISLFPQHFFLIGSN